MSETEALAAAIVSAFELYKARLDREKIRPTILTMPEPTSEDLSPIEDALSKSSEFKKVENWYVYSNGDSRKLTRKWLSEHAFSRWMSSDVPAEAARRASRVTHLLNVRKTPISMITLIWGVAVTNSIEVDATTRLVPIGEFRDAYNRQIDENTLSGSRRTFGSYGVGLADVSPAVLITTKGDFPFLSVDLLDHLSGYLELSHWADIVCRALATFGTQAPLLDASWLEYPDNDLNGLWLEKVRSWRRPEVIAADVKDAKLSVDRFVQVMKLLPKDPNGLSRWPRKILGAMKRFELCLVRQSPGDQSIDMCIAYEQVLGSGGGWKNGFRCAAVIGGNLQARLETRELVSALYEIRNKKVHGSESVDTDLIETKSFGKLSAAVVAQNCRSIFADVLFKLSQGKNEPDWFVIETQGGLT